jgi:hypothetical protein
VPALPQKNIDHWFTKDERAEIINQVITKIQLFEIELGEVDDQLLLIHLMNDML